MGLRVIGTRNKQTVDFSDLVGVMPYSVVTIKRITSFFQWMTPLKHCTGIIEKVARCIEKYEIK